MRDTAFRLSRCLAARFEAKLPPLQSTQKDFPMNKFITTITLALGLTAGLPALADNAAADAHAVPTVAAKDFIASGKSYFVDFGHQKFRLDFLSPEKLRFTSPDGKKQR